jgi:hypothetical protein
MEGVTRHVAAASMYGSPFQSRFHAKSLVQMTPYSKRQTRVSKQKKQHKLSIRKLDSSQIQK